ncbi:MULTISPECIES: pentalenene oxygenase [unclassified Streptomyces]|uniref:pentalenene oxygenase n=1 Tax=unclassified Streptomyces TaxID=2593676 RepID=UPI0022B67C62|nr:MULTISPECIES: cytochrome P450 [unclassified Streptomyces]MCZ7415691.1 cytochrome P450 [Streptomyces sp. WMMC897]MCZ7434498.1 cytochrome P450 [Streptomyces sp. WMMC1477]
MTEQTFLAGAAPGALPVVGHALQMMRHPVNFMTSLSAHGDLVEIKIGPTTAYVPTHPELLRQVLTNDRVFDKGGVFYDRARDIAGNGLVTCPFADHRRQRRLMQSAFTRGQLKRYAEAMHAEIEATASRWQDGMVVDAFQEMYGMALRTVGRTLYSTPVSPELAAKVERSFDVVLNGLFRQMFLPASIRRLPLPSQRRYQSNLDFLHRTTQQLIDDYRSSDTERDDLLAALIASRDEDGGRLGDKEIHDQVITVMAAGTETVAGTLTWVFYLLSQHPETEAALYDEIDTVLDGRAPQWDDLPNLSLADRIISETLRLHPPAWLFTRLTASPAELAGRQLPTGSTVVFSPAAVAQYEDAFDNPKAFDPDRWLPDRVAPASRHAFVPFGTGARKCIGDLYARTEATLGLATILGRWRVTCEPDMDIRPVPLATVYHPRRLRLRLDARTPRRMTSAVPAPGGGDAT